MADPLTTTERAELDARARRKEYKARARMAAKSGLFGKELAELLGVASSEAHEIAAVGRGLLAIEGSELSAPERHLMRSIAAVKRRLLMEGKGRGPESREVARQARRGSSWPTATAGKRLFVSRYDADRRIDIRGLGFVEVSGNGYINLTPAGWAVILWIERYEGRVDD